MLEIVDQCVRQTEGGELGELYYNLANLSYKDDTMIRFIKQRTGHIIGNIPTFCYSYQKRTMRWWFRLLRSKLSRLYIRGIIGLLPPTFKKQNVSLAQVGERHCWMYDFNSISQLLLMAGFIEVQRMTATTSNIADFPFFPLDVSR
ncbi:MAG: hypothetical protein AB1649_32670, partial [Chloroflexota bacterium]